uniref:J domain-containing protein n=1 Tax=Salix viminalis TaxID=40686 RepID=A0A6N2KB34_SALVM
MESPLVIGATVAAAAWSGKFLIGAWQAFKARPVVPRVKRFYNGGFEQEMTRREAALILGVRESAVIDKIKEAHRRVMVANHPDAGGSHYLASKINEAKELMVGKTKLAVTVRIKFQFPPRWEFRDKLLDEKKFLAKLQHSAFFYWFHNNLCCEEINKKDWF